MQLQKNTPKRRCFIQQSKDELRQLYKNLRQTAAPASLRAALAAAQIFKDQLIFKQSLIIACYWPIRDEFDVTPIMQMIWDANKTCVLPVLTDNDQLLFKSYQPQDEMQLNRFKILEPQHGHILTATEIDLVLLPLLAFDASGNRLGTGGGFYDRTFNFLKAKDAQKPYLLGVGYAAQEAVSIPADEWDIQLDAVLTEKGFRALR